MKPFLTITLALLLALPAAAQTSGLTAETWKNLPAGDSILILRDHGISARSPDTTATVGTAEVTNLPAHSGTRLRGSLTPPATAEYNFWVTGADNVALWISQDGTRFTKQLVAWNYETSAPGKWENHPKQKSIPITLQANTSYHIEAHVMSNNTDGHLAVAWKAKVDNWALAANGATATQSSTKWGAEATRANDGNTGGAWGKGELTLTQDQPNSWWRVDFDATHPVDQIVLFNNEKTSNQNQLSNFRISALDENDNVLVSDDFFTTSGHVGDSFTWNLPSTAQAAAIKIQLLGQNLAGNGKLILAEVQALHTEPFSGVSDFQIIPGTYLTPIASDPADANDNYLKDTWEQSTSLADSDHPEALLEHGDPDSDGISNYDEYRFGGDPLTSESLGNGITRHLWTKLSGNGSQGVTGMTHTINRQRILGHPNATTHEPGIDTQIGRENFGARFRGSFIAPTSGDYRFWIASSGDSQLWVADGSVTDPATHQPLTNRFGKQLLATSGFLTPIHDFDHRVGQRSRAVTLAAGETYYLEVLHKQAQGNLEHISVAWQTPGQTREIMPATAFLAVAPHPDDTDDDNLPDTWETQYNLDPADNGLIDPNDGEYGDADGDGLSNLLEYQYGTNPTNPDTDGDGASDNYEIFLYGSDPLVSNLLNPVTLDLPGLNQYAHATGSWVTNDDGTLAAQVRRGEITYSFQVTEPGVHEVTVTAGAISPQPWFTKYLPLILSLNDDPPFARDTLRSRYSDPDTMRAITPWLAAGTHTLTIFHENFNATIRLRLDDVSVQRLGGIDLDEDGVPDWLASQQAQRNTLTRVPATSRTSPASIEGITDQFSSLTLTSGAPLETIDAHASINDSFFADIPLAADGTATTLDASFLSGLISKTHDLSWIATNLFDFDQAELHIRQHDALRLDAASGTAPDGGNFTVSLDGTLLADENQNTTHTSGQPFVASFDTPGTFNLNAIHDGQSASVTLHVHAADFGPTHAAKVNRTRAWTPPILDPVALVEADDDLVFAETTPDPPTEPRSFDVVIERPVNRHVIARLPGDLEGAPSAILARGTVNGFDVATLSHTNDAEIIHQYDDGTWLMRATFVGVNLPPNVLIRLKAKNQGTLFTNGSDILELRAEDFDANGIAKVYYEWSGSDDPKLCTTTEVFIEN